MISFEEAGRILDEAAEALPEEIFRGLNGGVNLIPQVRRDENGLLVMGTYNVDQMGRRVEIYYGSFRVRYPDASPDKCAKALVRTLKHELRHHIENLAMDRSLERWDEQHVAELLSGLYDIEPLEVRSLLFADDEASGVAEMACSMFQSAAKGVGIDVVSGCACNEVGAISIRAARASLDRYGVRATACGRQETRFRQNRCAPRCVSGCPHAGQTCGGSISRCSAAPPPSTTPMISGMTSLERRIHTSAPMRTCFLRMSPTLLSVARCTVTPPMSTGERCASGVSLPVRPSSQVTSSRRVTVSCAGNL